MKQLTMEELSVLTGIGKAQLEILYKSLIGEKEPVEKTNEFITPKETKV